VRAQTYPAVEHVVVDGGSRDATAALVSAAGSARLVLAPGLGQAAAVNRGVAEARGEIVVILNADDVLYPQAVARLVEALERDPEAVAAYGEAVHAGESDDVIEPYPTQPFDPASFLESCYICQPASAVRRAAFEAIGGMDARLDLALDYDFWIRLARYGRFVQIGDVVAVSRMHAANKTLRRRGDVYREVVRVLRAHYGYVPYSWSYAYASWLMQRTDGFFEPRTASPAAVLGSLALGLWLNPRHLARYLRDWYAHRSFRRAR
jgi:GT2 family glycosyltransferase